jgi:LuxR family maltose regulon positive regulatory protein
LLEGWVWEHVHAVTRLGSAATGAPAASAVTATPVTRRALFERLREAARVVAVSAPAGSGKTVLLRSWAGEEGLTERVAWVSVRYEERDPQGFWVSVLDALRGTAGGKTRVRGFTAAPDLDGWAIVERLLEDLAELDTPLWLVIDDLHELRSTEAQRQLELFLMRAPAELRFVLSGRHDLGLGLHRLRLEAELTEIRARDMRFTLDEAQALFDAAGVEVAPSALELLVERTEGWAAGLRLAALSLAGHPDPERVAAEFSGSERTVSQYLLAEVLDRQPEEVRRLLLRTSLLEHVTGPLADLLSGGSGGERILQELEEANAFVVSLDAGRSRFRYYRLFADLLQLELRRTAPEEVPALHGAAAEWYAEHGYPVDAIRQAQAAGNRDLAVRLLLEHWFALYFDAEATTAHDLVARFAAGTVADAAELAALTAAEHLGRGTLQEAERHLALAAQRSASVPADRRRRFEITLAALWLQLAHQRGDLPAVAEQAQRLLAVADAPETVHLELADDLRAFALINLGIAELGDRAEDADRHLDQGIALAHRMERPYLELTGLAHATLLALHQSYARAAECSMQAIELAERHGWAEEPIVGVAYAVLGGALVAQGRLEEAEPWLRRAERALRAEVEPAATVTLYDFRGLFELASGHHAEALDAFRTAERLGGLLVTPSSHAVRLHVVQTLAKMGDVEGAAGSGGRTRAGVAWLSGDAEPARGGRGPSPRGDRT